MKRSFSRLFTNLWSVDVDGITYVPDWNAIAALAGSAAALIGLAAIWYSIRALRYQLRHQAELEAKQLERDLLLRVLDLAQVPYEASKAHVADIMTWQMTSELTRNPQLFSIAAAKVADQHRQLSTATAAVLHVVRRSRLRRFPRGTEDHAFRSYYDLILEALAANGKMLLYGTRHTSKFDLATFEKEAGSDGFAMADLLRRLTGELLARMYSLDSEWAPVKFTVTGPPRSDGHIPLDFVDDTPLGTPT